MVLVCNGLPFLGSGTHGTVFTQILEENRPISKFSDKYLTQTNEIQRSVVCHPKLALGCAVSFADPTDSFTVLTDDCLKHISLSTPSQISVPWLFGSWLRYVWPHSHHSQGTGGT